MLFIGHVINLSGVSGYGTAPGALLVFAAHVTLVFGLVAVYAGQAEASGLVGAGGMVLSVLGTAVVAAVAFVEIAGAQGMNVDPLLTAPVPATITLLGSLAFLLASFFSVSQPSGPPCFPAGVLCS
jgi:hypothetical protein